MVGVYGYLQPPGDRMLFLSIFGAVGVAYLAWRFWPKRSKSQPEECTLSETGICVATGSSVCEMPYSTFATCLESADMFVLLDQGKTMPFLVPRRIFPNEAWQNWFRARTGNLERPEGPMATLKSEQVQQSPAEGVKVTVSLGLRDYFDRALITLRVWGIVVGLALLFAVETLFIALFPPSHAVHSASTLFFVYELPLLFALAVLLILVATLIGWFQRLKNPVTETLVLSEEGLEANSLKGSATIEWSHFHGYRETWWSFVLWHGTAWVMIPKRYFISANDLACCRSLLSRKVHKSWLFFG
jgi:hypothetical protein